MRCKLRGAFLGGRCFDKAPKEQQGKDIEKAVLKAIRVEQHPYFDRMS